MLKQQLQDPPHLCLAAESLLPACAEVEDRVEDNFSQLLLGLEHVENESKVGEIEPQIRSDFHLMFLQQLLGLRPAFANRRPLI